MNLDLDECPSRAYNETRVVYMSIKGKVAPPKLVEVPTLQRTSIGREGEGRLREEKQNK